MKAQLRLKILTCLLFASFGLHAYAAEEPSPVIEKPFMETFPALKDYVFEEPKSGIYFGLGFSPIGTLKDKTMFSADFFQLHWISNRWDLELLNVSYGTTRSSKSATQTNNFTFRASPKIRIGQTFSIGPIIGYEYVAFPNLGASLFKGALISKDELFSEEGFIYGIMVTETFHYHDYIIQVNEVGYQENYSNTETPQGWHYVFDDAEVQSNPGLIAPSFVTLISVSFLF